MRRSLCSLRPLYSQSRILSDRRIAVCYRGFRQGRALAVVKPFILADIGEGIRECEVIQWFVEPEARVEQFDKLCEVQSDKASVEITSRYDGIVKKLHYQAGDMATVGKPLVDIDTIGESDDRDARRPPEAPGNSSGTAPSTVNEGQSPKPVVMLKHRSLATPAVRRLCREKNITLAELRGTGKDGRVLKEDILKYDKSVSESGGIWGSRMPQDAAETMPLTAVQARMFKTMSQSLSVPQFLYSDDVTLDAVNTLKNSINQTLSLETTQSPSVSRLTYMPFILKAVSMALRHYPILNHRLDLSQEKPRLIKRYQHNIGIAMDAPTGLLVPNIKNVQELSIMEIAEELLRLQTAGMNGKLAPSDFYGGTITISNIGSIGGRVVAPVIVPDELAILGVSRACRIPSFDCNGQVVPKTLAGFSWSADHRIIDGATMARMASLVKSYLEQPEKMLACLR